MSAKKKKEAEAVFKEPIDKRTQQKDKKERPPPQFEYSLGQSVWGGDRIDIPETPKVPNKFPLPQSHILGIIVGASGEGKSWVLLSLIPCMANLSQVCVCSLIIGNPVYMALESYCNDKGIKYSFASEPEEAKAMIEANINEKEPGTWAVNIFDDFNTGSNTRTNPFNQTQNMSYMMLRNYNCHSICLTQSYTNVSTLARNNANLLVCFRMKEKYSIWSISRDFSNLTGKSDEQFLKLYKQITLVKHSYIMVSEDKTYVYMPDKTQGLELVDWGDEAAEEEEFYLTKEDPKLTELVEIARSQPIKTHLKNLVRYIKILANENETTLPKMIQEVNRIYSIQIQE